ncbi:MAG: alginate export family protein [Deltaproteobacteria bacterium]|nr:alginate export family protein [Deltaproteobacteria bacterium]
MKTKTRLSLILLTLFFSLGTSLANAAFELADGKFKVGAQARFRYEFFNNTDFASTTNDTLDYVLTRVRPTFSYLPHEKVEVLLQPQFTAGWGELFGTSVTSVNAVAGGSTSGALNDPAFGVHQAYMLYKPASWFALTLGRQEWNYGDQLVIGGVDWHNVGRSFDAMKMHFSGSNYWIDALYSYLSDAESGAARGVATGSTGDHHFGGLYASIDLADWLKAWDLYALYRLDSTARPRAHNYLTFGTRFKGQSKGWDYRLEATGQFGKSTITGVNANQKDWQADLEVGYTWTDFYQFRIGLEAFAASKNYIQMFPTAHKWIGFVDLFGRRNIMGGVAHFSMKPSEKWGLSLDAHTIFRNSGATGLFRLNGVTLIGGTGASSSKLAGEELDFSVSYAALDILSFKAGVNAFIPMGFIKTEVGSAVPLFGYLQSNLSF